MKKSDLRARQVIELVLYLVCGHLGNQLGHPLVRKSPTCAYEPITYLILLQNQDLGPFWYVPSFLVQCLTHTRHPCQCFNEDPEALPGHNRELAQLLGSPTSVGSNHSLQLVTLHW